MFTRSLFSLVPLLVVSVACGGGDQPANDTVPTPATAAPAAVADAGGATTAADQPITADGAEVYQACATCHQADGKGMAGVWPPLAGSEWVTGNGDAVIAAVLHGVQGPIEVAGASYNNIMTPWGSVFDDNQIAAVVNYVRSNWGNNAAPVTIADVARLRAATAGRAAQFTASELAELR
jgi:mono/diheme cytochrome c family protein